jgi:hypothetical protein
MINYTDAAKKSFLTGYQWKVEGGSHGYRITKFGIVLTEMELYRDGSALTRFIFARDGSTYTRSFETILSENQMARQAKKFTNEIVSLDLRKQEETAARASEGGAS